MWAFTAKIKCPHYPLPHHTCAIAESYVVASSFPAPLNCLAAMKNLISRNHSILIYDFLQDPGRHMSAGC